MEIAYTHPVNMDKVLASIDEWNIQSQEKKNVRRFISDYRRGEITGNIPSNSTIERITFLLRLITESIKKDTKEGIRDFLDDLLNNKIRTFNKKTRKFEGEPIAIRKKKEILATTVHWITWKLPPEKSSQLTRLLKVKIRAKKNDINILTDEEIEQLIEECPNIMKRYCIEVLNITGMRAQEFHNLRFIDIEMPNNRNENLVIHISNDSSKTEGRPIQIADTKVIKTIKIFIAERLQNGMKHDELIYPLAYWSNQKWIRNFGKRILGKVVNYHIFRHSCATRMASKMNRQQLCNFFGWRYSSPMPDIYIQRSGVDMKQVYDILGKEDREDVRDKMEELSNRNDELWQENKELKKNFNEFKESISGGMKVLEFIAKRNKKSSRILKQLPSETKEKALKKHFKNRPSYEEIIEMSQKPTKTV